MRIERMDEPRRVLFVCVENSNRSQIAEAFEQLEALALQFAL